MVTICFSLHSAALPHRLSGEQVFGKIGENGERKEEQRRAREKGQKERGRDGARRWKKERGGEPVV